MKNKQLSVGSFREMTERELYSTTGGTNWFNRWVNKVVTFFAVLTSGVVGSGAPHPDSIIFQR